jgi:hypothetical protein
VYYGLPAAILFALWWFDRLKLDQLVRLDFVWPWAAAVLALLLANYVVAAVRLCFLLRGMGANCSVAQALSITFSAALGELALPVVVGGDLVKAVAVSRSSNPAMALASVVADRLIGLVGLSLFALGMASLRMQVIFHHPELRRAVLFLVAVSAPCLLVFLGLCCFHGHARRLVGRFLAVVAGGEKLLGVLRLFGPLRRGPHLWLSLLCAVLGHGISAVSVVLLAYALNINCPFIPALLVLPIVVICNTVSFAGGIGGGVIALEYLFSEVLGAPPGEGCRLGIVFPLVLTLSKAYCLPWFLFRGTRQ